MGLLRISPWDQQAKSFSLAISEVGWVERTQGTLPVVGGGVTKVQALQEQALLTPGSGGVSPVYLGGRSGGWVAGGPQTAKLLLCPVQAASCFCWALCQGHSLLAVVSGKLGWWFIIIWFHFHLHTKHASRVSAVVNLPKEHFALGHSPGSSSWTHTCLPSRSLLCP